jgi:hypothetical protein
MPNPSRISPMPPYTAATPVRPSSPARAQGSQPHRAATGSRGVTEVVIIITYSHQLTPRLAPLPDG